MSRTPAVCDAEQASRADLLVLRAVYMVAASGRGADMHEVRDMLILCHGLTEQEAGQAIADAEGSGLISLRDVSFS